MSNIKNKIIKSELVNWRDFEFIQPQRFKELSEDNYEKLRKSIIDNQFVESFKVWEHGNKLYCLDGYHRVKVLKDLEKEGYKIPEKLRADFISCKNKTEAAKLVLIYSSIYASITEEGLAEFVDLTQLTLDDFADVNIQIDVNSIFNSYSEEELNKIPDVPKETKIKLGDKFELGRHILICGDATDPNLYPTAQYEMVFIDPPYDINMNILGPVLDNIDKVATKNIFIMATDSLAEKIIKYINHWKFFMFNFLETHLCLYNGRGFYRKHIIILHYHKSKIDFINLKKGYSSIFKTTKYKNGEESLSYKHTKPVEFVIKYLESFKCERVLDCFGGYGTTLIAAEKLNLKCYMIEINPYYCELIIRRWEELTGNKAKKI